MKKIKIFMAFAFVLLIATSGWAIEDEMSMPPSENESENIAEETVANKSMEEIGTESSPQAPASEATAMEPEQPKHDFGHKLLFYVPNRVLDVFDFVRLRVRIGPGLAVGARVTKPISAFVGGYASVYVGLPGPRMEPVVKLPVGLENYSGVSVSVADATTKGKHGPNYSPTEIGAGFQLIIVGLDIGIDPIEVLDLATGFLFIDIRGDDL